MKIEWEKERKKEKEQNKRQAKNSSELNCEKISNFPLKPNKGGRAQMFSHKTLFTNVWINKMGKNCENHSVAKHKKKIK